MSPHAVYPKYQNKPIIPDHTRGVIEELEFEKMDLYDVILILETGFDCETSTRKKGIMEKCCLKKKKIIKVVVEDMGNYWLLRHTKSFRISKKKMRRYKHG